MSFSFTVPNGPADEFGSAAAAAKASLETQSEGNDYALTQLASATADAAIKAAVDLLAALAGESTGTAGGTISGHHPTDPTQGASASASVSVGFTPAPAAAATTH